MEFISTDEIGAARFERFAVDFNNDFIRLNGHHLPLGQIVCDIINLPKEWTTKLFYMGDNLNELQICLSKEGFSRELFREIHQQFVDILNYVKEKKPFSYFCFDDVYVAFDRLLGEKMTDQYETAFLNLGTTNIEAVPHNSALHGYLQNLFDFLGAYITLAADTLNFCSVATMFFTNLTENEKRTKPDLAAYAKDFFSNPELIKFIEKTNHTEFLKNFTLEPQMSSSPVVLKDKQGQDIIARRTMFNRMLNFYITDMFEGLAAGHYSWKCAVCGKFFLMTSAHKQLYCSTVNSEYGYPCAYVAKNKLNMPKQKKRDGFGYDTWRKRDSSIRKEKSKNYHPSDMYPPKYDIATCEKAKELIDRRFERAQIDFAYAQNSYEADMKLADIFAEAKRLLGK